MSLTNEELEFANDIKNQLILEQHDDDPELTHGNADALLCVLLSKLGLDDVVKEYHKVPKW